MIPHVGQAFSFSLFTYLLSCSYPYRFCPLLSPHSARYYIGIFFIVSIRYSIIILSHPFPLLSPFFIPQIRHLADILVRAPLFWTHRPLILAASTVWEIRLQFSLSLLTLSQMTDDEALARSALLPSHAASLLRLIIRYTI